MADGPRPFLTFQGGVAGAALDFYGATLPDAAVTERVRYDDGTVKMATLTIGSLAIAVTDSPIAHDFGFTPSLSFLLPVADAAALDRLAAALSVGGRALMPPGDYGFCTRFAWVEDRFGISWQLHAGALAWS